MRRMSLSRKHRMDLLVRPPCGRQGRGWTDLIVDPMEQLRELADLFSRQLLTRDEFERQKAKVLEF